MKRKLKVILYCEESVEDALFKRKEMLDVIPFHEDSFDNEDIPGRTSEFLFCEEQIEEMSKELDEEITYQQIVDGFLLFLIQFSDVIEFEKNRFIDEIIVTIEMC